MNKDSQETSVKKDTNLIRKITSNSIISGIFVTTIGLGIEYYSGIFQTSQNASSYSISPIWSGLAIFTVIAFCTSSVNFLNISINSRKYFREEYSLAAVSMIFWLTIALGLSIFAKLMAWYPLVAILYILSSQKLDAPQPSSGEGYALLVLLIILVCITASGRQRNWNGRKSVQQYQFEQNSESIGFFFEGIDDLKRIWKREVNLEEYSASTRWLK